MFLSIERFENALRKHEENASIPYFDTTLDSVLPNPADSVIWSDDFLGDNSGPVTSGTFANWPMIPGCFGKLHRHAGRPQAPSTYLISKSDIQHVLSLNTFQDINADPSQQSLERIHNGVHVWIADGDRMGQMNTVTCAPADPVFYMHHGYIDCIWELFRQTSQTTPLDEYTDHDLNPGHWSNATMKPFELLNKDGVSEHYTRLVDIFSFQIDMKH